MQNKDKEEDFLSKLETWEDIRNMKIDSKEIRCPKGHLIAIKKSDRVEIKCRSCGNKVEVN